MPYIDKNQKKFIDQFLDILIDNIKTTYGESINPGILNYTITKLLCELYDVGNNPSYYKINTIQGILACASGEIYRRLSKYEDLKIEQNGDLKAFKDFDEKVN